MIQRSFSYFFIMIALFSCKKENRLDCFKSNGPEITETRHIGPFKIINLSSKIDLTIYQGAEYKVEVTAGKHIIKNITTVVSGDTLKIDNENKCNFVRGYKKTISVAVTLPYLKYLVNNGVGTIYFSEKFSQDTLLLRAESSGDIHLKGSFNEVKASSHGNGDLYMSGAANTLYVYVNGTNYLYANELYVKKYAFIETLTLGDCFLNATDLQTFEYNIHKSGRIFYKGDPATINNFSEDVTKYKAIKSE